MSRVEIITTRRLRGEVSAEHLDALASLRLDIFTEYPYLYRGQRAAELSYLASYAEDPEGCVILAEENDRVVGAVTGLPLRVQAAALRDPLAATSLRIDDLYYVGELLLRPEYRARGLGQRLLAELEAQIRRLGFRHCLCLTVVRAADHPLRPNNHMLIDRFLARTGFVRLDGITAHISWREVDGVERDHLMQYWQKDLSDPKSPP